LVKNEISCKFKVKQFPPTMSDYRRFRRLAKSIMPDFSRSRRDIGQYYDNDDARMMINELAMEIPPKVLKALLRSDKAMDDFINGVYLAEDDIGKRIVTDRAIISSQYAPQVHIEDGVLMFTVRHKGEEIIFAEYKLNYKKED
jgi:hypothetical protein